MIELITGIPGNAKTLYALSSVSARAAAENRPVFYHGIPELTLPWELLDDPKDWANVPPNAIVVIDEAQKTFRNRSLGTAPGKHVTDLETHRHLGIDLVLLTQHPSLIDPAIRRLVGRHLHLVRIWGMEASTIHKWDAVKDNCDKSRSDSEKTKWAFDKSYYGKYKSAEVHTMKRSIPFRVKMLIAIPLLLIGAVWYVSNMMAKKASGAPAQLTAPGVGVASLGTAGGPRPFDPVEDAKHFSQTSTPRVVGLPHTAPKYDELTKPTAVPVPAACVLRGDVCRCLTQQGTPLQVEFNTCASIAHDGFFQEFDPNPRVAGADGASAGGGGSGLAQPLQVATYAPSVTVLPYTPSGSRYNSGGSTK